MGYSIYKGIEWFTSWKANRKYAFATSIQLLGAIHFIGRCIIPASDAFLIVPNFSHMNFKMDYLLPYLGMVYLWVFIVYAFQLFLQIIRLQEVKRKADFSNQTELLNLYINRNTLIPDKIKIGTSSQINTPIVFGYWEPIILLPVSICTYLSTEQIKLIVLHELAHINRNDYLKQLLLRVVKCILWFNPFAYVLQSAIQLQREMCCDEWVMKKVNAPIPYSKALFQIANQSNQPNLSLSLAAASNKNDLLLRLQYLNGIRVDYPRKFSFLLWLALALGSFFLLYNPVFKKQSFTSKVMIYKKENPKIINANTNQSTNLNTTFFTATKHSNKKRTNSILASVDKRDVTIESNPNMDNSLTQSENVHYRDLVDQTKRWIHSRENPVSFAAFNEYSVKQDSIENSIIEKLVLTAIIRNYQLKKTLLEHKLSKATNLEEATDYLMNSKEWSEMMEYEKWLREYQQKY